jgi:uncharacterized membrane protein YdbT with pleckstrin-like domain
MEDSTTYDHPIHESAVLLTIRLLLLQLITALMDILCTMVLLLLFSNTIVQTAPLIISLSIASILLQSFDAVMVLFIVLMWAHTTYIITPKEVIIRRGIAKLDEVTYELDGISEIEVQQDLLGRFFNYGTVRFLSKSLQDEVKLLNIPQPEMYSRMLRSAAVGQ